MSSVVNIDFDDILKEIAKAIYKNSDINDLGKALGFEPAEIGRKTDENAKQGGNYMGTLDLLRTWRNKQTPSTEIATLKEALLTSGCKSLAAKYLSTPVTGDDSTSLPSSTVTHGESLNRKDRIVTDKELMKLAGCLPADYYMDVAIYLGIEYTDYDNIKFQNQSSLKDAIFKMLMKWKTNKGGQLGVLDEALAEAQCGGLSYKGVDSTSLPSSSVTHGESLNRMDRMVTDGELDKLAGCLPADFYTRVAINLGVGYAERSNIKKQNAATLKDATFEMLMNWRREKDGGKVRDLDAALNEADCGGISYKDGSSATGKFGALGGKLSTESHGYTLHVPPGALEEDVQISLNVLTDIPKGLTLKEDELLVSHGFQCHPSGLRFKKPAKLTIPHCAIVTTPNKIQTVLYSWNQALPGTPKRLPDSSGITCSVQERWLEVSVSHFSGGFLALIYDWIFLKGILLSCMSFLPRVLNPSKETVLEVCFAKKPHGQKWTDVHELNHPKVQPVKRDDDEFVLRQRTLTVACQLGKKSPKSDVHNIRHSDLSMQTKVTEYFELDFAKESEETLVTLEVVQTSTRTIKFFTCFQGQQQETATGSSSAAMSASTSISRMSSMVNVDFDGILKEIAKALSKDTEIDDLGSALGLQPSDIRRYIIANAQQGVSYMGTLDMLRTWRKGQTTLTEKAELRSALLRAGFVNLADQHLSSSNPGQQQGTATGSSSAAMSAPTSTSRREVTDEEIYNLSKILPDKEYKRLGSILGFHFNYAVQILRKNLNDYRAAFEEILQEWNNKGGSMEDLDAALIKADLGKLVSKYKN